MTVLSSSIRNSVADFQSSVNQKNDTCKVGLPNVTTLLRVKRKIQEDPLSEFILQANTKSNDQLLSSLTKDVPHKEEEEVVLPKFKKSKRQHYYTFQRANPSSFTSLPTSLIPPPTFTPTTSSSFTTSSLDSTTDSQASSTSPLFRIVGTSIHEEYTILEVESLSSQSTSSSASSSSFYSNTKDISSQIEALSLNESKNLSANSELENMEEKKGTMDSHSDVVYDFYIPQWTISSSSSSFLLPSDSTLSPHLSCDVDAFPYFFNTLVHQDPWQENESDCFDDEEDSNAEDYYANDYPDESSHSSSSFSSSIHGLSDHFNHFKRNKNYDSDDEWDANIVTNNLSFQSDSSEERQKAFWNGFNLAYKNLFATTWSDKDPWDSDFSIPDDSDDFCYNRGPCHSSDVEYIDSDF